MIKPIAFYIFLSVLVVFFAHYLHLLVVNIDYYYAFLAHKLAPFFSNTANGRLFAHLLILVVVPILIAAVPALIYRLIKGKDMPYFLELTWAIWLIVILSSTLIR